MVLWRGRLSEFPKEFFSDCSTPLHPIHSFSSCILFGFPAVALVTVCTEQQCLDKAMGCTHSHRQQTPPPLACSPSVWLCVQVSQGIRLPCLNCACCEKSLSLSFIFLFSLFFFLHLEVFLSTQSPYHSQHKHPSVL